MKKWYVNVVGVSIHVPARGTTSARSFLRRRSGRFNPRSRKGNDGNARYLQRSREEFQSTFPQGERLRGSGVYQGGVYVSIHVPARGTTAFLNGSSFFGVVSIHVPARGTTGKEKK